MAAMAATMGEETHGGEEEKEFPTGGEEEPAGEVVRGFFGVGLRTAFWGVDGAWRAFCGVKEAVPGAFFGALSGFWGSWGPALSLPAVVNSPGIV